MIAALGRATRRGVLCRVLVDSVGSRSALSTLVPKLTASRVTVRQMLPVGLLCWKAARLDLRNHRKIAVIDDRIGTSNMDIRFFVLNAELVLVIIRPPGVTDLLRAE